MASLKFDIEFQSPNFRQKTSEIVSGLNEISKTIGEVGKNFSVGTKFEQIQSLKTIIEDSEVAIEALREKLEKFSKRAVENLGNEKVTNLMKTMIEDTSRELDELIEETNRYREALNVISAVDVTGTGKVAQVAGDMTYLQMENKSKGKEYDLSSSDQQIKMFKDSIVSVEDEIRQLDSEISTMKQKAKTDLSLFNIEEFKRDSKELDRLNEKLRKSKERLEVLKDDKNVLSDLYSGIGDIDFDGDEMEKMRTKMRDVTNEIQNLTLKYRSMTDEQRKGEVGNAIKERLEELKEEAANYKDIMSDVMAETTAMANDTQVFSGMTQGLSSLAGGFGIVTGTMGLFGAESKEMMELQTKLQSTMAITNGLTQIQAALQKQSAFMVTLRMAKQKLLNFVIHGTTAAEKLNAAATAASTATTESATAAGAANVAQTEAQAVAQNTLTGAITASTIALRVLRAALIATGIGALVVLLGGAVSAISELTGSSEEAKKKTEEEGEAMQRLNKQVQEYNSNLDESAQTEFAAGKINKIQLLEKEIRNANSEFTMLASNFRDFYDYYKSELNRGDNKDAPRAAYYFDIINEKLKNLGESWEENTKILSDRELIDAVTMLKTKMDVFTDKKIIAMSDALISMYEAAKKVNGQRIELEVTMKENVAEKIQSNLTAAMKDGAQKDLQQIADARKKEIEDTLKETNDQALINSINAKYDRQLSDAREKHAKEAIAKRQALYEAEKNVTETIRKNTETQGQADLALQNKIANNRIKLIENEKQKTMAALKQKHKEEREALDEEVKNMKEAYIQSAEAEFNANEAKRKAEVESKNSIYQKQYFDRDKFIKDYLTSGGENFDKQFQEQLDNLLVLLNQNQEKEVEDAKEKERMALYDFLSEYGSYYDKKLAITNEYEEKIANAIKKGDAQEVARLNKERQDKLNSVSNSKTESAVANAQFLGQIDRLYMTDGMKELARTTLDQLKNMLSSGEVTSAQDIKSITDAISQLEGGVMTQSLKELKRVLEDAQKEIDNYTKEINEYDTKIERLNQQRDDAIAKNDTGLVDVLSEAIEELKTLRQQTDAKRTNAVNNVSNASGKLESSKSGVSKTIEDLKDSFEDGNVDVEKFTNSLGSVTTELDKMKDVVLNVMDMFGVDESVKEKVTEAFGAVTSGIGAYSKAVSGDYIGAVGDAVNMVGNVMKIFGDGNMEKLQKQIDKLTQSNKDLEYALGKLEKKMGESTALEAVDYYQEMIKTLKEQITNFQSIMKDISVQSTGSKGSISHKLDDSVIEDINKVLNTNYGTLADMLSTITPEMLDELRSEYTAEYTALVNALSNSKGAGDSSALISTMEQFMQLSDKTEEWTKQLQEKLNGISFDTMMSNFTNTLKNMDSSLKDFANNIQTNINDALISIVAENYQGKLKGVYTEMAKALEEGDYARLEQLKNQYTEIAQAARDEVDKLQGEGYVSRISSGTASATTSISQSINQDQADEINGRLTSIQINVAQQYQKMIESTGILTQQNETLSGILEQSVRANGHLESIEKYTKNLDVIGDTLTSIKTKTDTL